jgi:hypothetical protein
MLGLSFYVIIFCIPDDYYYVSSIQVRRVLPTLRFLVHEPLDVKLSVGGIFMGFSHGKDEHGLSVQGSGSSLDFL